MKRILSITLYISFFLCASIYIINFFIIKDKDIKKYNDLVHRKATLTSCKGLERKPLSQKRTNVEKNIYFSQNNQRMQYKIISEHSDILITEKKRNF